MTEKRAVDTWDDVAGMKSTEEILLPSDPLDRVLGQEEAIALFGHDPRIYQTTVKEFVKDKSGQLTAVKTVKLEPKKDEKPASAGTCSWWGPREPGSP